MWIARAWYLLILLACAVGFAGVVGLPGHRDARVIQMRDRAADLEADLLRTAVRAARDEARQVARLAANSPRLATALTEQDPPLPPEVKRSLLQQALAEMSEGERRFVLVDGEGALLAASKGADGAAVAKDPQVKPALKDTVTVSLRAGRWMAAVPLPKPNRGALVALIPGPVGTATRAHAEAQPEQQPSRLVVLLDEKPVGGLADPALRETLAKAADKTKPAAIDIDDAPHHTRRYAVPAAPGMSVVLAWPLDPPTRLADAGGLGGVFGRGLSQMPELVVFGGVALLAWLLGLIIANAARSKALRRLAAEVDLVAAGPELEPIDLGQQPAWLRHLADRANESAAAARQRMQATMQTRIDQLKLAPSEVSAERPMDDPVPSRRLRAVQTSEPPAAEAERSVDTSTPPPAPAPIDDALDDEASTINHVPSDSPRMSPFADLDEQINEAEGEGTTELPARRMGATRPQPQSEQPADSPATTDGPLSDGPLSDRSPSDGPLADRPLSDRPLSDGPLPRIEHRSEWSVSDRFRADDDAPGSAPPSPLDPLLSPRPGVKDVATVQKRPKSSAPVPAIEDDEESLATIDHRGRPLLKSTPPAIEDAEASTDLEAWDMSMSGLDDDAASTVDSIQLPRPAGGGSLLAQLRDKQALDPKPAGGDRTVVRPIPMALLDATAGRDPDRTAVGPAPTAPAGRDALERYYEQIFEEFLEIKKRCGEPAAVEYRRFRARLVRTRKTLMERFNCVDVRFRVYVKDGRAALKAAPILDEDGDGG